ncbi:hypothetical protein ER57_05275 [Smithella sp. SCADC]|jgi:TRAP-type C4-dicarboxylate transport system permease small subunit|uniref:Putative TRAP transporter, DctQ-like membrane protein n=1 Tax=uncultured spirochete TaxID=156406 RepID=A0A3P3XH73_9SPIR|nr:TRAP transporter small permease [Rectinema subterraneum]KFO68254.1 hypothetical protein ER57_05275 [Smithella sp. SCADC]SLM11543.1 putative TRAP transporter, DctQ-like membrane protein [uncultured spirochete]
MKLLFKISDTIDRICGWAIVSLFSIMIISFALQVILRYFIGTGFKWTEELTRYANVWAVMIGFAMIAKRRNHINISVLEEILKGRNKKWLIIVQQLISLVIFTIMFIISFRLIKLAGSQLTTNMRLPKRWVYWIYPPAFSVFVFQTFIGILQGIQDVKMTSEVQA